MQSTWLEDDPNGYTMKHRPSKTNIFQPYVMIFT